MKKTKIYIKKPAGRISMQNSFRTAFAVGFALVILTLITTACGGSLSGQNSSDGTSANATPKMTSLERDIKSMETANFKYIYVFKRQDGGVFEAEDKSYLRVNSPPEVNRFVSSDEEKAFVAGSNFSFPVENLEKLRERFDVEDLSPTKETLENENTEGNKQNEPENAKDKPTNK